MFFKTESYFDNKLTNYLKRPRFTHCEFSLCPQKSLPPLTKQTTMSIKWFIVGLLFCWLSISFWIVRYASSSSS